MFCIDGISEEHETPSIGPSRMRQPGQKREEEPIMYVRFIFVHTIGAYVKTIVCNSRKDTASFRATGPADTGCSVDTVNPSARQNLQLGEIEDRVNAQIQRNLPVTRDNMLLKEARQKGAIGLFEDRYPSCCISVRRD